MNIKVIMRHDVKCKDVDHIMNIDLLDKGNPQFTLHFFGDACKDKELVKKRLDDVVNLYVSGI